MAENRQVSAGVHAVEAHLEAILSASPPLAPMELRLLEAHGMVLSDPVEDLPAGARLGATQVSLLAAMGHERVLVRPRPRLIVITLAAQESLEHPVPDPLGHLLAAAAAEAGALPFRVGVVAADPRQLREAVEDQLLRADVVVISGGVRGMGRTVVEAALAPLGPVRFTAVAMIPGGSQGTGAVTVSGAPVFVLPEDPAGAYVSFELFVRPAIRSMLACPPTLRRLVRAALLTPVAVAALSVGPDDPPARMLVPALIEVADERYVVRPVPLGPSASPDLAVLEQLAGCNALISLPTEKRAGKDAYTTGETVEVVVLDDALP